MEEIYAKIKALNEVLWENKVKKNTIDEWLNNFVDENERIHALYLLSQFMYFNSDLIREMLKALYRDLYEYRKLESIRKEKKNTLDFDAIKKEFKVKLKKSRFLAVGNPSESGSHILYYFRQENLLPKNLFINAFEIFKGSGGGIELRNNDVDHYVFVDDFCGYGSQAIRYSKDIVKKIKDCNDNVNVDYLVLFSTLDGINRVREKTEYDYADSVFVLDKTFKCFDDESRYFKRAPESIDKDYTKKFCKKYGKEIMKELCPKMGYSKSIDKCIEANALGFKDGQQMLGLCYNTPNNTLPIFWCDESELNWRPIFKRYDKIYSL